MTFSILSNDTNVTFEITSDSLYQGILNLSNGQFLDYDRATNHTLVVSVSDGESSNSTTVTVQVRSNQAPEFDNVQSLNFRVSESISETNIIAHIQASSEGNRDVLTYRLLSYTNLFEMDARFGDIKLAAGQVIDYEVTNRFDLMVEVLDSEFSNNATVILEVEDVMGSDDNGYCGVLTELIPVVIDGSSNAFFAGGDGTSGNPYVIAPKDGCEDFTFVYDPQYTTSSSNLNFRFLIDGNYHVSVINVEQLINTGAEEEGFSWRVAGLDFTSPQGFLSNDPIGRILRQFNRNIRAEDNVAHIITDISSSSSIIWKSKKGFRFQRVE